MEIYDISIAPGQIRELNCVGSYAYFYSGSAGGADATLSIKQDAAGERILLQPGQAFRMGEGRQAARWLIGNHLGQGTIVGRIVIGNGQLDDNRISGSVEVIDGEKARTMAGGSFIGSPTLFGTATEYPVTQLWNPSGSGRNLIVQRVAATSPVSGALTLYINQVEQATDLTASRAGNKRSGSALGVALVKAGRTTSASVPPAILTASNIAANALLEFGIKGAIVLTPGNALNVRTYVLNEPHTSIYEWFEEPI